MLPVKERIKIQGEHLSALITEIYSCTEIHQNMIKIP